MEEKITQYIKDLEDMAKKLQTIQTDNDVEELVHDFAYAAKVNVNRTITALSNRLHNIAP